MGHPAGGWNLGAMQGLGTTVAAGQKFSLAGDRTPPSRLARRAEVDYFRGIHAA